LNFEFSDRLNERVIENMYIYTEDYNFFKKEGALAILCEEIKPHLSDDVFQSIFYDKFPGYNKSESNNYNPSEDFCFNNVIVLEGITLFKG